MRRKRLKRLSGGARGRGCGRGRGRAVLSVAREQQEKRALEWMAVGGFRHGAAVDLFTFCA